MPRSGTITLFALASVTGRFYQRVGGNSIIRKTAALMGVLAATSFVAPPAAESAAIRTSYATSYCLKGLMANGRYVHRRAVAHNFLLPGTKIRLVGPQSFYGLRKFIVSDTGPALRDGHFDIWSPSCSRSIQWGRRAIRYKLGWGKL